MVLDQEAEPHRPLDQPSRDEARADLVAAMAAPPDECHFFGGLFPDRCHLQQANLERVAHEPFAQRRQDTQIVAENLARRPREQTLLIEAEPVFAGERLRAFDPELTLRPAA